MWYLLGTFCVKRKLSPTLRDEKIFSFLFLYLIDEHGICRLLIDFNVHLNVASI